jgi:predicted secreted protein
MATKVKGNDVIVWAFDDPDFKPVACSTSCTLEVNAEIIEKMTVNSGVWKEPDYQSLEWKVTVDNVIILDDASTKFGAINLLEAQINFLSLLIQFSLTDGTLTKVITGRVIVPSNVFTGGVDDFARHSVVLQGTGAFAISNDLAIPIITIDVNGIGGAAGRINSITLIDTATLLTWTITGPFDIGTSNTWVLDGLAGRPGPGAYYVEAGVQSDQLTNHFIMNAPPTVNASVGSGITDLNTAPFGNSVAYDFTVSRTITFNVGS